MFAQTLCVLLAIGLVFAKANNPLAGVDPNTLQCDPAGQVYLNLPHFTDCSKYFTCDHGREVEMPCAPGTIFDFVLQVCNHPWATTCRLRDRNDEIEGSGDDESDSGSGSGDGTRKWHATAQYLQLEQVEEDVQEAMPVNLLDCGRADTAFKQLPYRGDCQRYWRCNGRSLETVYCSDGLFFNPDTRQCDFEANVKCVVQAEELGGEYIVYK